MRACIRDITEESIVDGPGIRTTIWFQGCGRHCEGCHNPDTWKHGDAPMINLDDIVKCVTSDRLVTGVTFSGGDPMDQPEALAYLAAKFSDLKYSIWCYTGLTWEEIQAGWQNLSEDGPWLERHAALANIDVLVDGPFIQSKRDLTLPFRGSKNQRLIDVRATTRRGIITLWTPEN